MATWFYVERTNGKVTFHQTKVSKSVGWVNKMITTRAEELDKNMVSSRGKTIQVLPTRWQYHDFYYTEKVMKDGSIVYAYAYHQGDTLPSLEWRSPDDNVSKISTFTLN